MPGPSTSTGPDKKDLLDHSTRTSEQFVSLYYSAIDSPSRSSLIPTLYLPTSTIVWNGNPIQGQEGIKELVDRMPFSRYEIQVVDCHPIGGQSGSAADAPGKAPSLMLTVGGTVTHHTSTSYTSLPASDAPSSSSATGGSSSNNNNKRKFNSSTSFDPSLPIDALPRAFSQSFVLVDQKNDTDQGGIVVSSEAADGQNGNSSKNPKAKASSSSTKTAEPFTARYFVLADNFRFTG